MSAGRGRHSVRTLAWGRRTRRRRETDLELEVVPTGEPRAGENFEFVVSSKRRLARVATYIDRSRVWEVSSVDPPHLQRIFVSLRAGGQTLRIRAVDDIGNTVEKRLAIRESARGE